MSLELMESQFQHIDSIRKQLIQPTLLQLHPNIDGFHSPDTYGVYRHTGGKPLGVVGFKYKPQDLELFLDNVVHAVESCNSNFDLKTLAYNEYNGGSKVSFSINSHDLLIDKSPVVNDVLRTKLHFITGFDGLTKTCITFFTERLKCTNGARSWKKEFVLAFKNTAKNVNKSLNMCNEIFMVQEQMEDYQALLNRLTQKEFDENDKTLILNSLLEIRPDTVISPRKKNILDDINRSVGIEEAELGKSYFALLQGITRYNTHVRQKDLMFGSGAALNRRAHELIVNYADN